MKKLTLILCILCAVVCLFLFGNLNTSAEAATYGDLTYEIYEGEVYIAECNSSATTVEIPAKIAGYPVTTINDYAFSECTSLTSVTIPDSVTAIYGDAFKNCTSLTSITIPDSVTTIGRNVFYNTGYYNSSSNWENGVLYIDRHLIEAEASLSGSYSIKTGTKTIADAAFYRCTDLTAISVPDSVTIIGCSAFAGCGSLENVAIGVSVTTIGNGAFNSCSSLTGVTIPDSVTTIGGYAFGDCYRLTSVTIPDSVTSIGESAFRGCTSLESITLPFVGSSRTAVNSYDAVFGYIFGTGSHNSGTVQQFYAMGQFYWYNIPSSLKTVTITDATQIPFGAFYNCSNLTSITILDGVTTIDYGAFCNCSSLTAITVPDGVTSLGEYAFWECTSLISITLPDSITSIGDDAFYNTGYCTNSSNWENGALYIGKHLIVASSSLSGSYSIKAGTKTISDDAFGGCHSLESITIPDSVTAIGDDVFVDCTSLAAIEVDAKNAKYSSDRQGVLYNKNKTLLVAAPGVIIDCKIPDSVTTIGRSAFRGCANLERIAIGDNVTTICQSAFLNCTSLTAINIPDSVTSIGGSAFYITGYYKNSSNWENGVLYIGRHLIETEESLSESYSIKAGTKTIGGNAFEYRHGLKSITIPDSVTTIGDDAFKYCIGLTDAYYNGTKTQWDAVKLGEGNEKVERLVLANMLYIVTFKNYDGKVLVTSTHRYGDAVKVPADPTRATDKTYTYAFAGWDKEVAPVTDDVTYTATYKKTYINYTVTFKNYDGKVLSTQKYHYGDKVTAPKNPTRPADSNYTYTFAGWHKTVGKVTGNAAYIATYKATPKGPSASKLTAKLYGYDDVQLSWAKGGNANYYYVYYKKSSSSKYTYKAKTTGTSYKLANLSDGVKYDFKVVPYYISGKTKTEGTATAITFQTARNLKAPSKVTPTLYGHDDVLVKWSKVSYATAYRVYYKASTAKSYTYLGATTGTSYKVANLGDGVKYTFKIVPCMKVNGSYYVDDSSKTGSVTTLKTISTPKVSKSSSSKVKVSWTNIGGESVYQISVSTTATGTTIKTTYKTTSGKSKTISVEKGVTYYYKVRAYKTVDGKNIYGPWSSVVAYKLK